MRDNEVLVRHPSWALHQDIEAGVVLCVGQRLLRGRRRCLSFLPKGLLQGFEGGHFSLAWACEYFALVMAAIVDVGLIKVNSRPYIEAD